MYFTVLGRRAIEALRVKCAKEYLGCEWEGTVGTLEGHLSTTCKFMMVPCPNECEDKYKFGSYFYRGKLAAHLENECPLREFACQYCGENGTYTSITVTHDEICPQKIIFCPNDGCIQIMQRQLIKKHLEICEYTLVLCKYKSIGCDAEMRRKDIAKHEEEKDKVHLHVALDAVAKLVQDNTDLKCKISSLQSSHAELQHNNAALAKLVQDNTDLKWKVSALQSSHAELQHSNATSQRSQALSQHLLQAKVNAADLDVLAVKAGVTRLEMAELESEIVETRLIALSSTERLSKLERGNKHTFMVSQYEKKKMSERPYTSQPFYSCPNGYHMAIRVYANGRGEGQGTHVSVFVELVQGKFDEQLSWPFIGKVHVTLLNQFKNGDHHCTTISLRAEDNVRVGMALGHAKFIQHTELVCSEYYFGAQYLMGNALFFRVSIEANLEAKPWLNCT